MSSHGSFPISRQIAERVQEIVRRARLSGLESLPEDLNQTPANAVAAAAGDIKGFRHFLTDQEPARPFKIRKQDSRKGETASDTLRKVMTRLAHAMDAEFDWPPHSNQARQQYPDLEVWENPNIPAGYTYLLQLIAHDLVATSFPVSILEDTAAGVRNTRPAALRLDTIYGGGPTACPFAYAPDDIHDNTRTKLRLGPIRPDPDDPGMGTPLRDIARMPAPASGGVQREGLTEPVLADPRNDDNAIISQMTALFHAAHNGILGLLPPAAKMVKAGSVSEAAYERFICARSALTLIYRHIIRKDLLARILHPEVYALYDRRPPGFEFLDKEAASPNGNPRIPLEFSHAAFRFGHAMLRPFYRFNERSGSQGFELKHVLRQTSGKLPTGMPFNRDWIIRWSCFFEIDGSRPNLSRRIGPAFSADIINEELFPPIDEHKRMGVPYRDLLGGGFLNLWSAQGLIEAIEKIRPNLMKKSPFLNRDAFRGVLKEFLKRRQDQRFLERTDVDLLVENTPLAFFVLFEAACEPEAKGFRLGMLGSIIIADVIHATMARDPVIGETSDSLKGALEMLSRHIYGENFLHAVPEINSMADLIRFTAEIGHEPGLV